MLKGEDSQGRALTFRIVHAPTHGWLGMISPDSSIIYTPDDFYEGDDFFSYVARNNYMESNLATVAIKIRSERQMEEHVGLVEKNLGVGGVGEGGLGGGIGIGSPAVAAALNLLGNTTGRLGEGIHGAADRGGKVALDLVGGIGGGLVSMLSSWGMGMGTGTGTGMGVGKGKEKSLNVGPDGNVIIENGEREERGSSVVTFSTQDDEESAASVRFSDETEFTHNSVVPPPTAQKRIEMRNMIIKQKSEASFGGKEEKD